MAKKKEAASLNVKLVKSLIAKALGINKIGVYTVQPNNPANMGKIKKIIHLVEVTEA